MVCPKQKNGKEYFPFFKTIIISFFFARIKANFAATQSVKFFNMQRQKRRNSKTDKQYKKMGNFDAIIYLFYFHSLFFLLNFL